MQPVILQLVDAMQSKTW